MRRLLLGLAIGGAAPITATAAPFPIVDVLARDETIAVQSPVPGIPEAVSEEGDADDPAVWVHPTDPSRSRVYATAKNGGLRIYDLGANQLGGVSTDAGVGDVVSRFNNIDVQYGFDLNGARVDLAVATDRGLDKLKVWRIDADTGGLTDIGATLPQSLFGSTRPLDDQATGYGLALWRDKANDRLYALVTQRQEPVVAQFELVANADGTVGSVFVRDWRFPDVHDGQDLRQEDEDDPRRDYNPQFEGLVVDQRTGVLYAGQESVGVWTIDLRSGVASDAPVVETRGSGDPDVGTFFEPGSPITRDIEGLTIYYTATGGYLLASSQGQAHGDEATFVDPTGLDDSFAVFDLAAGLPYLGSFQVVAGGGIDGVQESDGADVIGLGLPGYPLGLFITQDGYNGVLPDGGEDLFGDPRDNNFKFVGWETVARGFGPGLRVDRFAFDPRTQLVVPAPAVPGLFGLGVLALAVRRVSARGSRAAPGGSARGRRP